MRITEWSSAPVPAPPRLPTWSPLGHLAAAQTDILELFGRATALGPVVDVRMAYATVTVMSSPSAVHQVLVANAPRYTKDTRGYELLKVLLGTGLVTAEGDLWRRQRRIANPAFHRTAIEGFVSTMQVEAAAWADRLPAEPTVVDVARGMHRLALGIAGRTLLGRDLTADGDAIGAALEVVLPGFAWMTRSILPEPWRWPLPASRRFLAAVADLDRVVREIIAARRADPVDHPDLLGLLMTTTDPTTGEHMSDTQLRDEVLTMLLAGHETTANGLAWALHLLALHPEITEAVVQEVARVVGAGPVNVAHVPQLDLTSRVFEETMRLYPPVWVQGRRCVEDDVVDGVMVPAGRYVFLNTYGIHRHPDLWVSPERFDPDRFLPDRRSTVPKGAYHPFSLGQRKCIGDRFAHTEAVVVLATLLQRARFAVVPNHTVVPEPTLTLRPQGGLPMRVSRPMGR